MQQKGTVGALKALLNKMINRPYIAELSVAQQVEDAAFSADALNMVAMP